MNFVIFHHSPNHQLLSTVSIQHPSDAGASA